jgi:hypothetical protein
MARHHHLDLDAQRSPLDEPLPRHGMPQEWPPRALQLHQRNALAGTWHAITHTCTLKTAAPQRGMACHSHCTKRDGHPGAGETWHARAARANPCAAAHRFQREQDMAR